MSFQTFVTERLAAITSAINAISSNAKKIDELPEQTILDPNSKIHVSKSGISEKISIQQIINSAANGGKDELLYVGTITLVSQVLTIPLNISWKISNVVYTKSTDTTFNIAYCAAGKNRKDIIVCNNTGQVLIITGSETTGIVVSPTLPPSNVLVTEISVSDSSISNSTPIVNNNWYKGNYNASTNTPTLADGTGTLADEFRVAVAGTVNLGSGNISLGENDVLAYNGSVWYKKINNNQSGGSGSITVSETVLTYTSSAIFTIPQNKQIISIIVGEVRSLPSSKYTYSPSLATNNFEITDSEFISNLDSGTTIIITTI